MKKRAFQVFLLLLAVNSLLIDFTVQAQVRDYNPARDRRSEKDAEQAQAFTRTDSLVRSHQFVFQADGDVETFVLVDSLFGEIQNGNRNNLQGYITQFESKRNEKRKQLSVSLKIRGVMYTADVVLFMDASGKGKATVLSEFPENFTFIGELFDFKDAWIYEGPSHIVH